MHHIRPLSIAHGKDEYRDGLVASKIEPCASTWELHSTSQKKNKGEKEHIAALNQVCSSELQAAKEEREKERHEAKSKNYRERPERKGKRIPQLPKNSGRNKISPLKKKDAPIGTEFLGHKSRILRESKRASKNRGGENKDVNRGFLFWMRL